MVGCRCPFSQSSRVVWPPVLGCWYLGMADEDEDEDERRETREAKQDEVYGDAMRGRRLRTSITFVSGASHLAGKVVFN